MDLKKLTNTVKAKNVQYDILGNAISVGDIVAIAYHSYMYYGLVYEVTDRFVRAYDKRAMDKGKNIPIGRGIVGTQCIVIQRLVDKDVSQAIENKAEENAKIAKEEKKNEYKKIFLKWTDNIRNITGFLIWSSMGHKNGFKEAINNIKTEYPNFTFQVLNKAKKWESIDTILISNLKIIPESKLFVGSESMSRWKEYFTLFKVPIEVQKEQGYIKTDFKYIIHPDYTDDTRFEITRWGINAFKNIENVERPIKCVAGLELDMEQLKSYNAELRFEDLERLFS